PRHPRPRGDEVPVTGPHPTGGALLGDQQGPAHRGQGPRELVQRGQGGATLPTPPPLTPGHQVAQLTRGGHQRLQTRQHGLALAHARAPTRQGGVSRPRGSNTCTTLPAPPPPIKPLTCGSVPHAPTRTP